MKKIIKLEPAEELISIIDRLIKSPAEENFLVVPQENKIFQDSTNLKLLKREMEAIRKKIIIVSSDPRCKKICENLKIETRTEPPFLPPEEQIKKEEFKIFQPRKVMDIIPRAKEEKVILKKPKIAWFPRREKREEIPLPKIKKGGGWVVVFFSENWIYLLLGLALIVAGLVVFLTLPKSEIKIIPIIEELDFSLDLKVKEGISQLNFTEGEVPGQYFLVQTEKSKEFPTTGEEERKTKARGTIAIYNAYSSQPQTLVATTRFISSSGKLFRIPKSVVVPGAKVEEGRIIPTSVEVEVVADQPGQDFNIGPTTFSIPGFKGTPKYTSFYAKSFEGMKGGFTGLVKIVQKEDLENAQQSLSSELLQELEREIKSKIPSNLKLLEEALTQKIVSVISDKKEGEGAETFNLTLEGIAQVLVFSQDDIQSIVENYINLKTAASKEAISSTRILNYGVASVDFDKEALMNLTVEVKEKIAWRIDAEEIQRSIVGKNGEEIRNYLSNYSGVREAEVKLWPFWVNKAPENKNRIRIEIIYPGID